MSGQIIESVEEIGGDESGDDGSVLDLVLFVGFLIVCYLLADSFGIINKSATPTEKASATPTATANAAQTTVVVAPAGTTAAPAPGISDAEIVPGPVTEQTKPDKLVVSGVSAAVDGEYTEGEPGYDGNVKVGRYYSATKQGAYVWINWGTGAIGGAYGDGGTYGLSFCKAEVDSATSTVRVTCRPFKLVVSGVNPAVNGEYVERETGYDGNVKIGRYYSATKAGEYVWINWGTGVAKAVVGLGTFDLSKCTRTVDNTAAIVRIDCTPPAAATTKAPAPVPAISSIGSTPTPRPEAAPTTPGPLTIVAPATPVAPCHIRYGIVRTCAGPRRSEQQRERSAATCDATRTQATVVCVAGYNGIDCDCR